VIIQCDKVRVLPQMTAEQKKKVGYLFHGPFFNWVQSHQRRGLCDFFA